MNSLGALNATQKHKYVSICHVRHKAPKKAREEGGKRWAKN